MRASRVASRSGATRCDWVRPGAAAATGATGAAGATGAPDAVAHASRATSAVAQKRFDTTVEAYQTPDERGGGLQARYFSDVSAFMRLLVACAKKVTHARRMVSTLVTCV